MSKINEKEHLEWSIIDNSTFNSDWYSSTNNGSFSITTNGFYGSASLVFFILGSIFTYFSIKFYVDNGFLNTNLTLLGAGLILIAIILLICAILLLFSLSLSIMVSLIFLDLAIDTSFLFEFKINRELIFKY